MSTGGSAVQLHLIINKQIGKTVIHWPTCFSSLVLTFFSKWCCSESSTLWIWCSILYDINGSCSSPSLVGLTAVSVVYLMSWSVLYLFYLFFLTMVIFLKNTFYVYEIVLLCFFFFSLSLKQVLPGPRGCFSAMTTYFCL